MQVVDGLVIYASWLAKLLRIFFQQKPSLKFKSLLDPVSFFSFMVYKYLCANGVKVSQHFQVIIIINPRPHRWCGGLLQSGFLSVVCVSVNKISGQLATRRPFLKPFVYKVMIIFTTHDCRYILFEGYHCRITA